jgi:hypothetical protein
MLRNTQRKSYALIYYWQGITPIKGNGGKEEMTETTKITIDPRKQIRMNKINIAPEDANQLMSAVERAIKAKKPAKEDLQLIRKFLIARPDFSKAIFDGGAAIQNELITNMIGGEQEVIKMAVEEYTLSIRDDMGYHDAPIIEKLIIENIVTCWLRLQHYEQQVAFRMQGSYSLSVLEFWERRLSMAQRRYLAACESLTRIRRMAIPSLQLNIGDKQINVAGNLHSPKIEKREQTK